MKGLRLLLEEKHIGTLKLGRDAIKIIKTRKSAEEVYTGHVVDKPTPKNIFGLRSGWKKTDTLTKACIFDSRTCQCSYHCYQRQNVGGGGHEYYADKRHHDLSIRNVNDSTQTHFFADSFLQHQSDNPSSPTCAQVTVDEDDKPEDEFVMSIKNEIQVNEWKWKQRCYFCKVCALQE
ncbi:hypothetical protein RFI_02980 [Reticulomyxa filosa]|uniref:Uncharacterized protein n=1 Tax=Reticulomyxa filosa TaxID=46433 RepID=X6P7L8_RETFI|nr:hypothetical protein RFI_02980 [Reticulomyxa filosa]|eukprot:ETO34113.1 hypothetical protein RFI_02980 [Reticulomyxa filosa]